MAPKGRASRGRAIHSQDANEVLVQDSQVAETSETSATIRILVASDSHVGYAERDVIRGRDSINSFNEVMELAKNRDVDMVLLAGDLFHDSKPSQSSMFEVIRSLRINCLGNKPCEVQVLADDPVIGHDKDVQHINTQDYHVNVAIPVYSIHGNHDDPSGFGGLCALDIIQAAGLVNYFGRVPQSNDITVRPILMQKGTTRLALYGLSNVREERLHQSMRSGKVAFMRPSLDDTGTVDDSWLNILAVHQNHHAHSTTNYLPESMIPNWFNLIVWGHEHECLIDPVENQEQGFAVCQPGSSVATSLCQGEAQTKHVGILTIKGKDFSMEKIPLKTVRPFIMKEYRLVDEIDEAQNRTKNGKAQQGKAAVIDFLIRKVDEAIEEAIDEWLETHQGAELDGENTTLTRSDCPLPLIRVRVDYTKDAETGDHFEIENPQRFSQRFIGRVANPTDVVQFHLKKKPAAKRSKNLEFHQHDQPNGNSEQVPVSELVRQYLEQQSLKCLPETEMANAVTKYVEKDDKDAVKDFVEDHLERQVKLIVERKTAVEAVEEAIESSKGELGEHARAHRSDLAKRKQARLAARDSDFESADEQPVKKMESPRPSRKASAKKGSDSEASYKATTSKKRQAPSQTTAKAANKRNTATTSRASKKVQAKASSSEDSDDGFEPTPAVKKRKL